MSRSHGRQQRSQSTLPALTMQLQQQQQQADGGAATFSIAAGARAQTPDEMLAATLRRVYPSPPPSAPHTARPASSGVRTARRPGTGTGSSSARSQTNAAQASIHFQTENLHKYSLAPTSARSARSARHTHSVSLGGSTPSSRPTTSHSSRCSPCPPTPLRPQSQQAQPLEESKEWSPPMHVPASARSARSHYRSASSTSASPSPPRRRGPLAGTDLAWGGGAESARLPASLEPRACMESSMALARAELDFIHSDVFDVRSAMAAQRAHQSAALPHPSVLYQLPPPPFVIPPTMHAHLPLSLVPTPPPPALPPAALSPPLPQLEEADADDDDYDDHESIDIEALLHTHHAHSSALVARSLAPSPSPPTALTDAATVATAAAASASLSSAATPAARAAHRAWLSRLNAQYDADWADTEAEQVQREQNDIQQEYEAKKEGEWRERQKERREQKSRSVSSAGAAQRKQRPEHLGQQRMQPQQQSDALIEPAAPAVAAVDAATPVESASSSSASDPAAPLLPSVPASSAHSQFASLDPAMDEGIDVAALPLAFQLPVPRPSKSSNAEMEQGTAASAAAGAEDDAADLCTVDAHGVDVEQAVAQEAFATSAASARALLDRHDRYQARLDQLKQAGQDDRIAAAAVAAIKVRLHKTGVEVQEEESDGADDESKVDDASAHPAQVSSPPQSPRNTLRYLKAPGSAAVFFSATAAAAVAAAEQQSARAQSAEQPSLDTSSYPASPLTLGRTVTGAGTNQLQAASANRGDIIKSASLRTSGWGSQVARQQNQKVKAQAEARSRRMTPVMALTRKQAPGAAADGDAPNDQTQHGDPDQDNDGADGREVAVAENQTQADADADTLKTAAPVGPFARPSSSHSQRSWSNRIKRNGMGDSAGRGSDLRRHIAEVNSGTEFRPLSAEAQAVWKQHNAELERARVAEEERREREHDDAQVKLHKQGRAMVSTTPAPDSASFPRPGATHAAADEERQEPPEAQAALPRYMQSLDRAVARATTREVHQHTTLPPDLRYEGDDSTNGHEGEKRLIVRSAPSTSRHHGRDAMSAAAAAPPVDDRLGFHLTDPADGPVNEDDDELDGAAQSSIFPRWLWSRPDFQHTYSLVPFETCLRILHLFPDERTDLHIGKLREWIGQRAAQRTTMSAAAAAAAEGEGPASLSGWGRAFAQARAGVGGASSPLRSRGPSRSPSRAASRAPSRAVSRAVSRSGSLSNLHSLRPVVLPPSPVDYLATLPRFLLDGVLRVMKTAKYAAGETIYRQGEAGDSFMVLQSGRAQSSRVDYSAVPVATAGKRDSTVSPSCASPVAPPSPAPPSVAARTLSNGSNKRASMSRGQHIAITLPPSTPGGGGGPRSARSSVTFSPQASVSRSVSSVRTATPIAVSSLLVPSSATSSPHPSPATPSVSGTETVQLLLVGNAFGHQHLARELEATSQAGVARKRTLRLWHLLRLSVRRQLREEERLVSQLSRLTYGASSGDPDGSAARSKAKAAQRMGGGSGSSGGGSSSSGANGLSEAKIRSETVVALTDCVVFTISFYAFASLDFEYQQTKLRAGIAFLGQLRFFRTWTFSRLRHLYSLLLPRTLRRGEMLWRQGATADELCFVEEGSLALSREVVVTEGHRHPVRHLQWECEETTMSVSCVRPFATAEAHDYVGEDAVLDSATRDYSVRCRSDRARVWLLRKRYTHLLTRSRHHIEDVARLRRQAAATSMAATLKERYPAHHATNPFVPVDWAACRAGAHGSPGMQALHYLGTVGGKQMNLSGTATPPLDLDDTAEFLCLPAGAIYVRWDPPPALLRAPASSRSPSPQSQAQVQASNSSPADAPAALGRPRRVYRLFTAPQSGTMDQPVSQYFSPMPNANRWTNTGASAASAHRARSAIHQPTSARQPARSRSRNRTHPSHGCAATGTDPSDTALLPQSLSFAEVVDEATRPPAPFDSAAPVAVPL